MHEKIAKRLIGTAAAAVVAVSTLTAALPSQAAYKQEEYLTWSQLDERWGATPMDSTTVRSSGCLITSLAIMIMDSGSLDDTAMKNLGIEKAEDFNPGVLAKGYTSIGGFGSGGYIKSWLDIQKLVPKVKWGYDQNLKSVENKIEKTELDASGNEVKKLVPDKAKVAAEVQALLEQGWYIIARVNTAYGGWHWVYIRGVDGEDIYMSDPANLNPLLYEVYPDGLQGEYWALKGANSPETEYVPPEQFEPYVNIEVVTPPKTVYAYGEELDLSGCMIKRSGMDMLGKEWEEEPVLLTEAENVSYSSYFFDPNYAGDYQLDIYTDTPYAYGNTSVTLTVSQPVGEYYLQSGSKTQVYTSELGEKQLMTLSSGETVNVTECRRKLGHIESKDFTGWVDVSKMTKNDSTSVHDKGDIDGDGSADKYDLAKLSVYLKRKSELPECISTLTEAELKAADMNGDGALDEADFIALLTAIQN
ncbi:MAG: hypothetical protein K6G82_08325 [Ruminococcus sp.]|nr:hypothetical protein [Ruminococcus sp.]